MGFERRKPNSVIFCWQFYKTSLRLPRLGLILSLLLIIFWFWDCSVLRPGLIAIRVVLVVPMRYTMAFSADVLSAVGRRRARTPAYLRPPCSRRSTKHDMHNASHWTTQRELSRQLLQNAFPPTSRQRISCRQTRRKRKHLPLSADMHSLGRGFAGRMDDLGICCRPYLSAGCDKSSRPLLQHEL